MRYKLVATAVVAVTVVSFAAFNHFFPTKNMIRNDARGASVAIYMQRPIIEISYTHQEEVDETPIDELIVSKIEEALEIERELYEAEKALENTEKYNIRMTTIEVYGVESPSRTEIPIGSLLGVPEWARYPEKVLSVYKIESSEINEHKEEFEDDVRVVSETANVSISKAKDIMSKLRADGYTISKDEINTDETVELLHFDDGWNDSYPTTLRWEVTVEGSDDNIITGYDPRGVIKVRPIPEDAKVYVKTAYYDLENEYKPISDETKRLQDDLKEKEEELDRLRDEIKELTPVVEYNRDIRTANMFDLMAGRVQMKQFWMMSGGSGAILGNYDFGENPHAWHSRHYGIHFVDGGMKSVVLTNAHVAIGAISVEYLINKDSTTMWIMLPARPYIRHTATSDRMGNPAAILFLDGDPVLSTGIDTAILITSEIPGTDRSAILGNSDKVTSGTDVLSVGNPLLLTKFSTEGIVSQTNFNLLQSPAAQWILPYIRSSSAYDSLINASFNLDTPIGAGGVSGSPVFALSGSQKGKVVAIRNSALMTRANAIYFSDVRIIDEVDLPYDFEFMSINKENTHFDKFFSNYPLKDANFSPVMEDNDFNEARQEAGYVHVPGMNIGIPINLCRAYLQERGLDPKKLGFDPVDDSYWEK